MSSEELSRKLRHAEAELADLRSQMSRIKKDVQRKDKCLAKATSRSTKLEGLLMQTEGEAEQLRAKCAETEAAVAEAKRKEATLLVTLQDTSSRLSSERNALVQKCEEVSGALAQKLVLVENLQSQVSDTQKLVLHCEKDRLSTREEGQARECEILRALSEKEEAVSRLRFQLREHERAHQVELGQISEQRDLHRKLLSEQEMQCTTMRSNLEDSTLAIFNLQLRLKEAYSDIESERRDLQSTLSRKESEIATLEKSLADKSKEVERLSAEATNYQTAIDHGKHALSDSENKLQHTECSLGKVQRELVDLTNVMENETKELRSHLSSTSEELSETRKLLAEKVAASECEQKELSHLHDSVHEDLVRTREEMEVLSSKLRVSQQALQAVQCQLSETTALSNDRLRSLEEQLFAKEYERQKISTAFEKQSRTNDQEFRNLTMELSRSSAMVEEKDSKVLRLEEQLQQSEESLTTLKDQIWEEAAKCVSRENELESRLSNKCRELEDLNVAFGSTTEEYHALQTVHEAVRSSLSEAEVAAKNTISLLEEQLENAKKESQQSVSECSKLHTRLAAMEQKSRAQSSELECLQSIVADNNTSTTEYVSKLQALQAEKGELEQQSQRYQEQLCAFETEKIAVVQDLKTIYSERDQLTACIEELKQWCNRSVLEAQEDAAKRISDLSVSNEDLKEQRRKRHIEAGSSIQKVEDLQQKLLDAKREANEAKQSRDEMVQLKTERSDLLRKLRDAEVQLEQTEVQIQQLSDERERQEVLLRQEIHLKESTSETKDVLLEQLKEELAHVRAELQESEVKNRKMESAVTESNKLLLRAEDENKELMNVLSHSQAEFEETLESASSNLKTIQRSEQVSKAAYRLLLDRLRNLKVTCGFEKEEQQSVAVTPPDLHSEVNLVIVQLEEHFQGSKYLEVELSDLTAAYVRQKESNENLQLEQNRLQLSLDNAGTELRKKREELDSVIQQERETQVQLSALNDKISAHELWKNIAERKNASLEKACDEAKEKIAEKDSELTLISAREEKANMHAEQFKALADSTAKKLENQDRAAEVALTSLQRRVKELESEISGMSVKQHENEENLKRGIENLQETCKRKDAIAEELEVLREAHAVLVNTVEDERRQWQQKMEAVKAQLKMSEEALHSHEESSLNAMEEMCANKELVEDRCREAERERDELQAKSKVVSEVETEKRNLELSLHQKENALKKHIENLEQLRRAIASLEAEKEALQEKYVAQQIEAQDRFERKFQEASECEDKKIRAMKSELQTVEGDAESLRQEMAALREELDSEKVHRAAEVTALERKFDAAKIARDFVQKQKDGMEGEIRRQTEINEELAITINELRDQLKLKGSSTTALSEKLGMAEMSISALEEKVKTAEAALSNSTQEHSAAVDDLLHRLERQQTELETAMDLKRDSDLVSEKRLMEIERIQEVVKKLKQESVSSTAEAVHLEALIRGKSEEMVLMQDKFAKENDSLHKKCAELSTKYSMAQEEINDAGQSQLRDLAKKLDAAQNELTSLREETSRRETECKVLEEAFDNREDEMEELKSAIQSSSNNLEAKMQTLLKAQTTIAELSRQITELESGRSKANQISNDSEKLEMRNIELQRRGERLGVRSKKLLRRLKRVEKLLAAEKRKNLALTDVSAKRQASPSTKGMSPSMKRIRDLEQREPLSPIPSNARPPMAPKPSVRYITF